MRLTKSENLFKKLAVIAGLAGASALMGLPVMAMESLVAQSGTTRNPVNPANPDATGGGAFEQEPSGQPLPSTPGTTDQMNQDGTMMDESTGGGAGGVEQTNPVNPANPDATGGGAFEREPSGQPLPSTPGTTDDSNDFGTPQSGTTTDDAVGGGAGGAAGTGAVRALW
ncbi:hypothetical protein [Thermocoleostomius sinensis]|uniref:Uncharacterized protein n=1 Tax=Thermocoleostomius sinensis A174 TaxID=2016057 RepID=A0A9E8Z8G0_9CYAN|nr:hypothetical protein [Thermocoleostomius sinensis]WAL58236.1 hypothetical protein OXH18_13670 [Thermocoleostomius sinensis A174]